MEQKNVPQDESALGKVTREVCYVTDENGNYVTDLSTGWEVKKDALDAAWKDIDGRIAAAMQKVDASEASPLLFFMEYRLMDINILSDYTGLWKWQIKRHLKPTVFKKLSPSTLQKYAEAFNVSIDSLKSMHINEG
ncbi:MAG: hypothetical protein P4L41_15075 [Flavipsychrobacter sp.]|nr:hypothetical protein [Flavipsychrobacter sp.]